MKKEDVKDKKIGYYKNSLKNCLKLLVKVRENFINIQEPSVMMSMMLNSAEFDAKSPRISTMSIQMTPFEINEHGTTSIKKE